MGEQSTTQREQSSPLSNERGNEHGSSDMSKSIQACPLERVVGGVLMQSVIQSRCYYQLRCQCGTCATTSGQEVR
jgi:hypothetical protein